MGFQAGGALLTNEPAQVKGWAVSPAVTNVIANGAIPIVSGIYVLSTTGAGAFTLRAPTLAENGTMLIFTAGTAAAHVVTATALIQDGVVGGPKAALTTAAFLGAGGTLMAVNAFWHVRSLNAATVA